MTISNSMKNETVTRVIEQSEIAPPPGSVPSPTTLPLTFLDIGWFFCPPIQRIFFYHFPHPTHHFLQTTLPILKHSLSITLQHFFPFSSNLIIPPNSQNVPYIRYLNGDFISLTVVESSTNFNILISDSQDTQNWYPLVPNLCAPRTEQNGTRVIPLMSIQITILPNFGFSICLTFSHIAGDGKSLHHFMKFWASISKARANYFEIEHSISIDLPSHERDRVKDPKGLKLIYLKELQDMISKKIELPNLVRYSHANKVRTTLVLNSEQVQKLKKWVSVKCKEKLQHMSTFVVTCSLIWFCMVKSEQSKIEEDNAVVDDVCYLVFMADCRDRPRFLLPKNYFGNCLATCIVAVKRDELVGKNGIVVAANGIERKIRDFKSDALLGFETLMSDYRELSEPSKSIVYVAGSPKLAVYETDFGWGKPVKSEAVHIDSSGSISLSECRVGGGGIEVGLALERIRMTNFINIFEEVLHKTQRTNQTYGKLLIISCIYLFNSILFVLYSKFSTTCRFNLR
ncbi:coumaroyl-CoA:anthocyanidin 3-O-glucoside-6''-O-coumaroyltransferase 1-like [Cicer arietinum]|uniref:Coumaroyl-CoA:anthocyanidin 3-O-glucoside-6''-O-coumaroyltransferase 1-like n=1 Tax=Cicer arietinum TaxID=3827 RepID=A0A1S2XPL4_CICAR|nr:coumaroyl-CoA:anthocyanidin 3-O-glucoside-6''-O-coumaroyltransferase 1-like [Cicer arietinum]